MHQSAFKVHLRVNRIIHGCILPPELLFRGATHPARGNGSKKRHQRSNRFNLRCSTRQPLERPCGGHVIAIGGGIQYKRRAGGVLAAF